MSKQYSDRVHLLNPLPFVFYIFVNGDGKLIALWQTWHFFSNCSGLLRCIKQGSRQFTIFTTSGNVCTCGRTFTHVHINLNTIFYTYIEDNPAKTTYIRHYMETHTHTHNDCSRNWVLILVGVEIFWEEEGFQGLQTYRPNHIPFSWQQAHQCPQAVPA